MDMTGDEKFMRVALRLARRGVGRTSPNPPVGAVIVKNGEIIGRGYHRRAGLPHAEIEAINDALSRGVSDFSDATMYVTLEPCSHWGRTPPCAVRLVEEKFRRVVVGTIDPNPKVAGRGIKILRDAGIEVTVGVCEDKARRLIEPFSVFITKKRAYCALKYAQSVNGIISLSRDERTIVSGERAHRFVHRLRDTHDAVIIGAGTLLADDPALTVRLVRGRNPVRVVIAGRRKIPPQMRIFTDGAARTVVVSPGENPFDGAPPKSVEIWHYEGSDYVPVEYVLRRLAEERIMSALCEGGAKIAAAALAERVVDRVYVIINPRIFPGGVHCPDEEIFSRAGVISLTDVEYKKLGEDILLTGRPVYR